MKLFTPWKKYRKSHGSYERREILNSPARGYYTGEMHFVSRNSYGRYETSINFAMPFFSAKDAMDAVDTYLRNQGYTLFDTEEQMKKFMALI